MEIKIKNIKEFSGMFFFELVLNNVIGVRGFKIGRDSDGDYELILPELKNKRGIYNPTSVIYSDEFYDRILEHALVELAKINGSNEVIK